LRPTARWAPSTSSKSAVTDSLRARPEPLRSVSTISFTGASIATYTFSSLSMPSSVTSKMLYPNP
jgi:hypothetical protein